MAIKKEITFEGLKYNLDNRDRIAAAAALETFKDATNTLIGGGFIVSGSTPSSGQMFVTGSADALGEAAPSYHVLAIKV